MEPLEAFGVVDVLVGRVHARRPNAGARKPAFKLWIDFGPVGIIQSRPQLVALYTPETLVGGWWWPR